ncbi:eIF1/SUI1 family translation initiation factor [Arcobacter acticola]|jgi:translation initiation factor 1|uniref:eIF1/SUI1 family translation initiation factor n=1 Tax=Arcobacter acticola TaxID=1849015 RepID=A0A6M8ESY0_9BACT|nr:translation initiation factor SUI1 [Arcobacter acticola]QKE27527.1 eIF1/SUI1 family translation initiation factor [Arcobacter acticola]
MGLADKLAFSMGAKLDGDSFDTVKEDKKKSTNQSKSSNEIIPKNQHQLVFTCEKRKGKPVTLVGRFNIKEDEKKEVLKLLKKKLACGGAIKDEWIELQGDLKEKIKTVLESDGWKFRK